LVKATLPFVLVIEIQPIDFEVKVIV